MLPGGFANLARLVQDVFHGKVSRMAAGMTLKELVHELTAEYTMADEPVLVTGWDSEGNLVTYTVTGISVRTWHGKLVQSLKLSVVQ